MQSMPYRLQVIALQQDYLDSCDVVARDPMFDARSSACITQHWGRQVCMLTAHLSTNDGSISEQ